MNVDILTTLGEYCWEGYSEVEMTSLVIELVDSYSLETVIVNKCGKSFSFANKKIYHGRVQMHKCLLDTPKRKWTKGIKWRQIF